MKKFEIWMEGYHSCNYDGRASLIAVVEAKSFKDACKKYFERNKDFDLTNLTFDKKRLFDNEEEAREIFG